MPQNTASPPTIRIQQELQAVNALTEQATNDIMNVCDDLRALSAQMPPALALQIQNLLVRIYECCAFHDISSQRLTRALNALRTLELQSPLPAGYIIPVEDPDSLMNGPQLPGHGVTQDDADTLLGKDTTL